MPNKSIGLSYPVLKEIVLADNNNLGTEVYCPTCNNRVSTRLTYDKMCPFCNTLIVHNAELSKANFLTSRSYIFSEFIRKDLLRYHILDSDDSLDKSLITRTERALLELNNLMNKMKSLKKLFPTKDIFYYDIDLYADAHEAMMNIAYVAALIDAFSYRSRIKNSRDIVEINNIATIYIKDERCGDIEIVPHSHYMTALSSIVNEDPDKILKQFLADMNTESPAFTFMSDPVELLESNKDIFSIIRVTETMGDGDWEWKQLDDPIKMLFKHGALTLHKVKHETNNVL